MFLSLCPSISLLRKLFCRLLTWRPAEGEHVTTQNLSDKQLVGKYTLFFLILECVLVTFMNIAFYLDNLHICWAFSLLGNKILQVFISIFNRLHSFINSTHVALRTPFPRSQWIFRPALTTSTPSAVLIGLPWRTVGRVSTTRPRAFVRTAPGAGPQRVSPSLSTNTAH